MARIIKASEFEGAQEHRAVAMRLGELAGEVRTVVLDARKQAARILADGRAEAELLRLQAEETGYREGFARGQEEGGAEGERRAHEGVRKKIETEMTPILRLAESIVDELAAARANLLQRGKSQVLQLAMKLAEQIVGRLASTDLGAAGENLKKVLKLAQPCGRVCIKVNPAQLAALHRHCADMLGPLAGGGEVELIGDAGISPGGVKLIAPGGEIDATIETQLANVAEALLGAKAPTAGTYVPVITENQPGSHQPEITSRKPRIVHGSA